MVAALVEQEAVCVELLPNLTMRVARTEHLIALKVLSCDDERRPQDLIDLRAFGRRLQKKSRQRVRR